VLIPTLSLQLKNACASHMQRTHGIFIDEVEGSSSNLVWRKTLSNFKRLKHQRLKIPTQIYKKKEKKNPNMRALTGLLVGDK
jgi:hypothetical protein